MSSRLHAMGGDRRANSDSNDPRNLSHLPRYEAEGRDVLQQIVRKRGSADDA